MCVCFCLCQHFDIKLIILGCVYEQLPGVKTSNEPAKTHTHSENMLHLNFKTCVSGVNANHNNGYCGCYNSWQTFSNSPTHTHTHTGERKRVRKNSQMFYGLLNLSVIAVRVASTQRSLGFLQGLLNGFSSCSHSAARTETLNTSLQPINNQHTH